jgi:hypothetical protein
MSQGTITINGHKPRGRRWRSFAVLLAAAAMLVGGTQALSPAPAAAFNEQCIDNPLLCETGGGGGGGGGSGEPTCDYWFWRWWQETNADARNVWWTEWLWCLNHP